MLGVIALLVSGFLVTVHGSPTSREATSMLAVRNDSAYQVIGDKSLGLGARNPNKKKAPKPATDEQMKAAAAKGCDLLYLLTASEADALARMKQMPGKAHLTSSQSQWTSEQDLPLYGWSETFGDQKWTYLGIDDVLRSLNIKRDDPAKSKSKGAEPGSSGGSKKAPPLFGTVPDTKSFNVLLKQGKRVKVDGKKYKPSEGEYNQVMYPEAGLIIPYYVYSPGNEAKRLDVKGDIVPLARYSDVLALEYARLCGAVPGPVNPLQYYMAANVENTDMWAVALKAVNNKENVGTLFPDWPGISFDMSTEEGKALLSSPIASAMAWMLITHKKMFGMRTVSKAIVFKNKGPTNMDDAQPYPTVLFEIVSVPEPKVLQARNESMGSC